MFQIIVIPNNTTSNLSLCFKTEKAAKDAHEAIRLHMGETIINVTDDFSNTLHIAPANISYTMFIDVAKSQWREYEQAECVNRVRQILSKRSPLIAA